MGAQHVALVVLTSQDGADRSPPTAQELREVQPLSVMATLKGHEGPCECGESLASRGGSTLCFVFSGYLGTVARVSLESRTRRAGVLVTAMQQWTVRGRKPPGSGCASAPSAPVCL